MDVLEATEGEKPCYAKVVKSDHKNLYMALVKVFKMNEMRIRTNLKRIIDSKLDKDKVYTVVKRCNVVDFEGNKLNARGKALADQIVDLWEF